MSEIIGEIRKTYFHGAKKCQNCGFVRYKEKLCPECGAYLYRRHWVFFLWLNTGEGELVLCICPSGKRGFNTLLKKAGYTFRTFQDLMKGLKGTAWIEAVRYVHRKVKHEVIGSIFRFRGEWRKDYFFIESASTLRTKPKEYGVKIGWVPGELETLASISRDILEGHVEEIEKWGDTYLLRYYKFIHGHKVEVRIKAPLVKYAEAYRIRMLIDDVHMYPAKPVELTVYGLKVKIWASRKYHGENWKENIAKELEYFKSIEERGVNVVRAAKDIEINEVAVWLKDVGLYEWDIQRIINDWTGENLWSLVAKVEELNPYAGLTLLKNAKLLLE